MSHTSLSTLIFFKGEKPRRRAKGELGPAAEATVPSSDSRERQRVTQQSLQKKAVRSRGGTNGSAVCLRCREGRTVPVTRAAVWGPPVAVTGMSLCRVPSGPN